MPIHTYVLHIEHEHGFITHYVGSTREDQLRRRLRAHLHGYGARATRKNWSPTTRFFVVAHYISADRELENKCLRLPDAVLLCSKCAPRLFDNAAFAPVELHKKIGPLVEALTLNPKHGTGEGKNERA